MIGLLLTKTVVGTKVAVNISQISNLVEARDGLADIVMVNGLVYQSDESYEALQDGINDAQVEADEASAEVLRRALVDALKEVERWKVEG